MAPGASILLVEANDSNNSNLYAAVKFAADQPDVSVVSMSWGSPESSGDPGNNSVFTTPKGHTPVTFVAASGDSGTISYPAASPNVLGVGGTVVTVSTATTISPRRLPGPRAAVESASTRACRATRTTPCPRARPTAQARTWPTTPALPSPSTTPTTMGRRTPGRVSGAPAPAPPVVRNHRHRQSGTRPVWRPANPEWSEPDLTSDLRRVQPRLQRHHHRLE